MKTPEFPLPDSRDAPDVARSLRSAAVLWSKGRHQDALPHLMRAAAAAQHASDAPKSDTRVVELAMAATEIAAFVHSGEDPRSIPISLDFGDFGDVGAVDIESLPSAAIEIIAPPRPPPRQTPGVQPEPSSLPIPEAPKKQVDLSQTLPQGQKLESVPLIWQYAKAKPKPEARSAVPPSEVLREAPQTEPEPQSDPDGADPHGADPHGAPTRRMEDIDTKRDPNRDPGAER